MANRKLQMEIDRTLKKITEGVQEFEEILEKLRGTNNPAQRDKYEQDLKKEIKKLQRHRDQIKTWMGNDSIKDKQTLIDNRKLIETQMERFKAIEKELKTKAFSKEGLGQAAKLDPAEEKKRRVTDWINTTIDTIQTQIDGMEAQIEQMNAGGKKNRRAAKQDNEQTATLNKCIENHKTHLTKMEIVLRMLENGMLDTEQVEGLKDNLQYYLDTYEDDPYEDSHLLIYEELGVEEDAENIFGMGDHVEEDMPPATPKKDEEKEKKKETTKDRVTKDEKKEEKENEEVIPASPAPTRGAKEKNGSPIKVKPSALPPATPQKPPARATIPSTPSQAPSEPISTINTPGVTIKYATAAAAAAALDEKKKGANKQPPLPSETPSTPAKQVKPSVAPKALDESSRIPTEAPPAAEQGSQSNLKAKPKEEAEPASTQSQSQQSQLPTSDKSPLLQTPTQPSDISALNKAPSTPQIQGQQTQGQEGEFSSEGRLPSSLADLVKAFEGARDRAFGNGAPEDGLHILQMLDTSLHCAPDNADAERPKSYTPSNPVLVPPYYPSTPPSLFATPTLYEKFDLDTLFFIFYYQQGSYQQYLAARELKRQSWRFHKKYLTWFQRHEEPKVITEEYEQGTYIYFDYEGAWCQRKKTEFRFEYRFLEDAELL
ncbi:Not1 N-terminal domain, CCR4-Not complex component-domain-containing protein [Paraphysoderma sedebokerense]|nr:Not1 N-terminal domain, CCR4-Not complex component-domain-containing protein [Paraphysoderma sedebokerense]